MPASGVVCEPSDTADDSSDSVKTEVGCTITLLGRPDTPDSPLVPCGTPWLTADGGVADSTPEELAGTLWSPIDDKKSV